MRIDPEGVYLEIQPHALVFNFTTQQERHCPAVTLHWKDGRKWQRRSFFGNESNGETLEEILRKLGGWFDEHGLQGALDQAMGREQEAANSVA